MTDTKQLLEHLIQEHTGKHNAITQSKLAKTIEMNPSTLRSEMRRLREERNIPIGNIRSGYYIIATKDELQEFVAHKNKEIESNKKTIEDTLEAFDEFDGEIDTQDDGSDSEVEEPTYECSKCGTDMTRDDTRWPKSGKYEDQTVCARCYGSLLMEGSV